MHYIVPGSWLICMAVGLGKKDRADCVRVDLEHRRRRGAKIYKGARYQSCGVSVSFITFG